MFVYITVKVIVDLPDNQIDFRFRWPHAQELQGSCDVHGSNLVLVVFWLSFVTGAKVVEDSIELLLFDRLNLDALEEEGGTRLKFFHRF